MRQQKFIRAAARISATVLKDILVKDIEEVIDDEKEETHSAIAERVEDVFADPAKISKSVSDPTITGAIVTVCLL